MFVSTIGISAGSAIAQGQGQIGAQVQAAHSHTAFLAENAVIAITAKIDMIVKIFVILIFPFFY